MEETKKESGSLRFLYNTVPGRLLLRVLSQRWLSCLCGTFLDSSASRCLIKRFVRKNNILLDDYYSDHFTSFNDFFTRQIKEGRRPIPSDPSVLISPSDGLLSVYSISENTVVPAKQSHYSIPALLSDDVLSKKYHNGICLVFRLCVDHYHRYCYVDSGEKGENIFLPGKLHTVRPIALEHFPVFVQNCREYTVISTENFGDVVQMEVGALLVGKIKNHHGKASVKRGEEKGMFLFGGSTIILLFEKDRVQLNEALFYATEKGLETPVQMGQVLGRKI